MSKKRQNVVKSLIESQIGLNRSPYRQSLKTLHSLLTNKSANIEKIWSETSKQPIIYDDGKIYFNNHTHCLALCGKDSLPSTLYRLQKNTKIKRFEDIFIYSGPVNCTPLPRQDFKPYFLAVSSDNWLIRYDNISGKVLQEIYLGSVQKYSFRHIDWETQGETIVLQSTLFPNRGLNAQRLKVVQAVAVFQIMPLKFIGLLEIDQTIFGKEVNSANISEGLLILGVGGGKVAKIRIYSLREILKENNRLFNATLDMKCDDLGGKVGQYPFGLPLNYKITTVPPILFEVKCSEQNLHFGGYPWHYVTNPSNTSGVFEVRSVATNRLAESGRFDVPNSTTEADTLTFHSDDSGRLVYESGNYIKFYKFFNEENTKTELKQQFELKLLLNENLTNGTNGNALMARMNGERQVSRNVCYVDKPERQIFATDFENELEFYILLGIDCHSKKKNAMIDIYDNETGEKIHEFRLDLTLEENCDYSLVMDLDTIVITWKTIGSVKFECHIFRITRDSDLDIKLEFPEESEDQIPPQVQRKKRRKRPRMYY